MSFVLFITPPCGAQALRTASPPKSSCRHSPRTHSKAPCQQTNDGTILKVIDPRPVFARCQIICEHHDCECALVLEVLTGQSNILPGNQFPFKGFKSARIIFTNVLAKLEPLGRCQLGDFLQRVRILDQHDLQFKRRIQIGGSIGKDVDVAELDPGHSGNEHILDQVDRAARTAYLSKTGARVHLGGIGKGYAVDRAAAILRERGFHDFLIQSGGDLYVAGRNGTVPWKLGISDPRGPAGRSFATVEVSDGTLSTSGDYERFFIKDGTRYHHLIDPDRGEPATGTRSVTIVADRAMLADVLSTGVFLLGPTAGMALIEQLPQVEGVIVSATNQVLISSGLKGRLAMLARPTNAP